MDCEPVRAEGKKRIRREEKEKNMRLVLKHCVGGIEHLSFISGPHFSPTDSVPLPFNGDDEIRAEVYSLKNDSWNVIPGPGDDCSQNAQDSSKKIGSSFPGMMLKRCSRSRAKTLKLDSHQS
ncbi:hypothetical protein OROMI_003378 [Orobanche minor]